MCGIKKRVPTTPEKHIGIEIECYLPEHNPAPLMKAVLNSGLEPFVQIHPESFGMSCGHELTILDTQEHYLVTLKAVLGLMRAAKASSDSDCGLHVHLDARQDDRDHIKAHLMADRIRGHMEELWAFVTSGRRIHGGYGSPVTPYREGYQTLEVRIMDSNFNFNRISKYTQTLIKLAYE